MSELSQHLLDVLQQRPQQRFILGIVGCPAAGKSTLAQALVQAVNDRCPGVAVVVPMDGFHRYKRDLEEMQLLPVRGVPESFDAEAFLAALTKLRSAPQLRCTLPCFERAVDDPQPDMIEVLPGHRLLVVEGNYLLLEQPPWHLVRPLLDETWYVDARLETIVPRLLERHLAGGMDRQQAQAKIDGTDLPNAQLVEQTKSRAGRIIPA